jgi:hypothetical protein
MKVTSFARIAAVFGAAAMLSAPTAQAQLVSGSISGVVKDPQGAVVANVKVTVTDMRLNYVRDVTTNTEGVFLLSPLQPSRYMIAIEAPGFKKYEQRDIQVYASDRISLGDIVLEVGGLTETVTVEATAATIQAQGADRSSVLTGKQVVDIALNGRNFLDLARVVPGVVYTGGLGGIMANGNRGNQNNLTVDGVTNVDTGSNGGQLATMNIDQIADFKLLTNAQPAEFGRSSGAQIQVITKSGTKDFHGTGYWFWRHESLNANLWRNNIEGRQRPLERRTQTGFNIGGPVLLPGTRFNRNKDKLFFFVGMEWQQQMMANWLRNVRVPTMEERRGDFSQAVEGGGSPVRIFDPAAGGAPFPGMVIPAHRFNADGARIMNWFPEPNALGIDPAFNFQSMDSHQWPRRERIYRIDYNIHENWRLYSRFMHTYSQQDMPYGQWSADFNIPRGPMNFGDPGWSWVTNLTTVINPTMTNEFVFGVSRNDLNIDPVGRAWMREPLGLTYQMPFAGADPLGLVQNWRFGGVPNAPVSNFNGTPFRNWNRTVDISNNTTKIHGAHTLKFGIYMHHSAKDQTAFTAVNGDIWFDRDRANPGDTNWAFANALLGNWRQVAQTNHVLNGLYRSWNVEWYLQDSWRVRPNLTIDYGMRFYWIQPQFDRALQTASFNRARWDPAATPTLWQPFLDGGRRMARNPLTGAVAGPAFAGAIANAPGSPGFVGPLFTNGMCRAGVGDCPRGLINDRGIHYAPRLGIAWQFLPRTVLRAGGGVFYDRFQGNPVFDMLPMPPSTTRPNWWYGNLGAMPSAADGVFFPMSVVGFDQGGQVPTTYNWNVSIQRELPGAILFDIGYVGSRSLYNIYRLNHNAIPFGAAWQPGNQDPWNVNPRFDGSTTWAPNFYRPHMGFGDATMIQFGAPTSYHSLQVSANRRLQRGLTFGIAYTWSRALGIASGDWDTVHPVNAQLANFGPLAFDIPHNFVANWVYDIPGLSTKLKLFDNKIGRGIFNNWQMSGMFFAQSGNPDNIFFNIDGVANLNERFTGSPNIAARVLINDNPHRGGEARNMYSAVDSTVFRMPAMRAGTGWEHGMRPIRRPGFWNLDAGIFKNFPMTESRFLQLRLEMFNAFNNTQFTDFNRTMTFNPGGEIINLPTQLGGRGGRFGFGAFTATRAPRVIQLAMKFYF